MRFSPEGNDMYVCQECGGDFDSVKQPPMWRAGSDGHTGNVCPMCASKLDGVKQVKFDPALSTLDAAGHTTPPAPKLKWKVQAAPGGRYRSFSFRAWPQLHTADGQLVASLSSEDEYVPGNVKTGTHAPVHATVHDYRQGSQGRKMLRLKASFETLQEAKDAVERFLARHPEMLPKPETK